MIGGRRQCFVLHLRPGRASRYDQLHHAMPSAVAQELTAAGFRNYTLFRHEDLVIGYAEGIENILDALGAVGDTESFARWAADFTDVFLIGDRIDEANRPDICQEIWHLADE